MIDPNELTPLQAKLLIDAAFRKAFFTGKDMEARHNLNIRLNRLVKANLHQSNEELEALVNLETEVGRDLTDDARDQYIERFNELDRSRA